MGRLTEATERHWPGGWTPTPRKKGFWDGSQDPCLQPIEEHLQAYQESLDDNTAKHVKLTPRSFDIAAKQPVLQVEAACSKHRKMDVLPLHPELVTMLEEWLEGHAPDEPLFPRLDRKKTWLMVKKDLERVDIEYETPEGIADFHAAGRHTHVTELLRSGATLPEARELARHSDVRMTMRYTHIGLADQAKALAGLRVPKAFGKKKPKAEKQSWQRYGSGTRHAPSQSASSSGTGEDGEDEESQLKNPCESKGYVTKRQPKSSFGTQFDEWRRRELNPRPAMFRWALLRA